MQRSLRILLLGMLPLALVALFGCNKADDTSLIPSYISIEKISINVNSGQGTAAEQITDVWVYANQKYIGTFELPAKVPLLLEGETDIRLMPGIKLNGISSTRTYYPFFNAIQRNINLVRDSVYDFGKASTQYRNNLEFAWMEDFESADPSIDTTLKSNVALVRTSDPNMRFNYPGEGGDYSGYVRLTSDTAIFEAMTKEKYEFPAAGSEVFLEMNYKGDNEFVVGVKYLTMGLSVQRPLLYVKASPEWNKIYVNLTVPKFDTPSADDFQIFIGAKTDQGDTEGYLLFDNFKLIHSKISK